MSYDEMPVGPEMDRLVAEKVMGWLIDGPDRFGCIKAGSRYIVRHDIAQDDLEDLAFKPSKNIAHAWEVVEKMPHTRGTANLTVMRFDDSYRAGYFDGDAFADDSCLADTAPLAICRAALKAVTK